MKDKKQKMDMFWFRTIILILIIAGLVFAYSKIASLIRNGIESGLEQAFNAPAEVSAVIWSPVNFKIQRIAVVGEDAEEYAFVARNIRFAISFNHIIRKSFTMTDLNLELIFNEAVPAEKQENYRERIAHMKQKKEEKAKEKEDKPGIKEKTEDFKAQIKNIFDEYIKQKTSEISVYEDQLNKIEKDVGTINAEATEIIKRIDVLQKELQDLGKMIDNAYNAKDTSKILETIKKIDEKKKSIDALKKEVSVTVDKINNTRSEIVAVKNGIEGHITNIRRNYKDIIMADLGFFKGELPKLSDIFVAKELINKMESLYSIYLKANEYRKKYVKTDTKKSKKGEKGIKEKGRDIVFTEKTRTPAFWIVKGEVEVHTEEMIFSGKIANITSSNKEINDITQILLEGKKGDYRISVNTYFDDEKFYGDIKADNFPIKNIDLNVITIKDALANYKLEYSMSPGKKLDLQADVFKTEYSGSGTLFNLIKNIDEFYLKTTAKEENGKWSIKADSDLDEKIGENLKKEIEAKKKEAMIYAEGLFKDWYDNNIPEKYDILGKNTEILTSIKDISARQETLNKLSDDLKKKANVQLEKLKKEALEKGIKKLF